MLAKKLLGLISLAFVACAAPVSEEEEAAATTADELSIPDAFGRRIAMARFYQHARPAVPKDQIPKKVAELASVKPTYVSGLVRLDPDDDVKDEHLAVYRLVRSAIANVRVDIVLNSEHYLGPTGWERLEKRMRSINDAFQGAQMPKPDIFFFDFYSKGKIDTMERAAKWAQDRGQKIGGTFWATSGVPNGTDFLVIDDHDGLDRMIHQSQTLRSRIGTKVPILAHIENNPGQPQTGDDHKNLGLMWFPRQAEPKGVPAEADRRSAARRLPPHVSRALSTQRRFERLGSNERTGIPRARARQDEVNARSRYSAENFSMWHTSKGKKWSRVNA